MHQQHARADVQIVALEPTDPFSHLPDDVLQMVLEQLSLKRILALAATCRAVRERLRNWQVR